MRKNYIKATLFPFLLASFLLCACKGGISEPLTVSDYQITDGTTSKGVKIGDSLETFFESYEQYDMLISYGDEQYCVFHMKDILTEDDTFSTVTFSLLLPTFFVDDQACDTDTLCETYQVEKENLLSFLNSEDFLKEHTVVYEFILFDFQDGILTNMLNSSRDYNAEAKS